MTRYFLGIILVFLLYACNNSNKGDRISYNNYYQDYLKISELGSNGDKMLALAWFDSIASGVPHIPSSALNKMSKWASELEDCDRSLQYFSKAIENGFEIDLENTKWYRYNSCEELIRSSYFDIIKTPRFNQSYKVKIDSMLEVDQMARTDFPEKMEIVDSSNFNYLMDLIEQYGYPSEKLIGNKSSFNAFILMIHADLDIGNKRLRPILDMAYHSGYLYPNSFAWIVDRRRNWSTLELEPYFYHIKSAKWDSMSPEELKEIDRRRDSIGYKY